MVKKVLRGVLTLISALVALYFFEVAISYAAGFFWPDSGSFPGNAGHLFFAAFYLVLTGPFAAIAYVLGAPLITDDPRFRGADR